MYWLVEFVLDFCMDCLWFYGYSMECELRKSNLLSVYYGYM